MDVFAAFPQHTLPSGLRDSECSIYEEQFGGVFRHKAGSGVNDRPALAVEVPIDLYGVSTHGEGTGIGMAGTKLGSGGMTGSQHGQPNLFGSHGQTAPPTVHGHWTRRGAVDLT